MDPPTPPPEPPSLLREVIVAPTGVAGNPGTLAAPTTLEGAQTLLRNTVRSGPGTLRVLLRGGLYARSTTLALTAADSGTAANPIEYVAYGNEIPRLAGGVSLSPQSLYLVGASDPNWARLDSASRSKIYVADVSSVRASFGTFSSRLPGGGAVNRAMEAFADGLPLRLAQYPKAVDSGAVNLAPPTTLRISGGLTPDVTGDYAYKGVDSLGRSYYQLAKGGDLWSIAASASGADWYLSNRKDLGGTGSGVSWGSYESFGGPAGRFDPSSKASGAVFMGRADGSNPMPGFMLVRSTNGSTQIIASDPRMSRWRANEAMYFGMGYYNWEASHVALTSLDSTTGTIQLASSPTYGLRIGQPFFLYNLLEELTDPGDYFLDRVNGRLYLRPRTDALPGDILLSTMQAPLVTMRSVNHVHWKGITFEATQNNLVDAQSCSNVTFANCLFRNAGGWGLLLSGSSNRVQASEFTQLGKGGIWICGGDRHTLTGSGSVVENCEIHHYSRLFWTYQPGINIGSITKSGFNDDTMGITIQHNEIHHAPHQAILFQGNDITMRYNHIHNVCQWTNDAGALYSQRDWGSQGNLVQFNLIRHSGGPFGNWILGIYLDSGGSGTTIEGNILYKSGPTLAIQHNGGRDVKIRYNVLSGYTYGAVTVNYGMTMVNNTPGHSLNLLEKLNYFNYQSSPWATTYPHVAVIPNDWPQIQGSRWLQPENCVFYGNLFQGTSADVIRQENVYPAMAPPLSWFSQVSGNLSQVDPQFMDPANLDFRLKNTSPVFSIPGFPGIDASQIGIKP